jgi:anti-anti-sigma factor
MQVRIYEDQRVHIISLQDRVDAFVVASLREQIEPLQAAATQDYVIDLTHVQFMDSAGLAFLVRILKHSRANNGDTVLVWSEQDSANRILRLTKFDQVFHITESVEAAVKHLRPGDPVP